MFVDRVQVKLHAGKGGNGVIAWRREKYIPKGGPEGGDGGRGGSVVLQADTQISSLDWYRNRRILKAENGVPGGGKQQKGRDGKDLVLSVPCGTLVKDSRTGEVLYDLTEDRQRWIACRGGKGGLGNDHFKTATNRAPNICTLGKLGEEIDIELELKLIADVGLVGFPNAGKSTLFSLLAKVEVKTAPYPFTTLHPNLGYIEFDDYSRFFIADIPGIIEGAHQNRGLGFEFLRHIERTQLLIYILDASGIDGRHPKDDFDALLHEMKEYNSEMLQRPFFVVLNKIDTEEAMDNIQAFRRSYTFNSDSLFEISALTGKGIDSLKRAIEKHAKKVE